jgi:hypothetical protein
MFGRASGDVAEVYTRYSFGVDNQHPDVIRSCFAPDASLGQTKQSPTVGREAITARLLNLADPEAVHHAFNIVVLSVTGNQVEARADFTMVKHGKVFATGVYDDSLTNLPNLGWVFSRRSITYNWRASAM